jgi:hypothetical protein
MGWGIDGNLAALARYEREQDLIDQADAEIMRIEDEIWDVDELLIEAVRAADSMKSIDTAVEDYAKRLYEERCNAHEDY